VGRKTFKSRRNANRRQRGANNKGALTQQQATNVPVEQPGHSDGKSKKASGRAQQQKPVRKKR